jgi:hypothetical protein
MGRVIATRETLITPATAQGIDLAYAKLHLKSISGAEDTLVESWITAACQYFEEQTGRWLTTRTGEYHLDAFPCGAQRIEIPRPPLQSIVSVEYKTDASTLVPYTDGGSPDLPLYEVKTHSGPFARPGYIFPKAGAVWPTTYREPGAVRIQFIAGYGDGPEEVPDLVKVVVCGLVGLFDQQRSEVFEGFRGALQRVPFGVDLMMQGFKSSALPTTVLKTETWP